jgi:hypothetical protein
VNSDAIVAQLMKDVAVKEKISVPMLKFVASLKILTKGLSVNLKTYQKTRQSLPVVKLHDLHLWVPTASDAFPTFYICEILNNDGPKPDVEAKLQHTLNECRVGVYCGRCVDPCGKGHGASRISGPYGSGFLQRLSARRRMALISVYM